MKYDVHLIRFGPAVLSPATELRKVFPIPAKQAEAIVSGLPKMVKRGASKAVADKIAKALRDLGAEVECRESREATTPVAGSLRPSPGSSPPARNKRRMKATAVAGSFLPSDFPSQAPAAPAEPEKALPELTLDFDAAVASGRPRPVARGGSSAPPPTAQEAEPGAALALEIPGAPAMPNIARAPAEERGEVTAGGAAVEGDHPPFPTAPTSDPAAIELGPDDGLPPRRPPSHAAPISYTPPRSHAPPASTAPMGMGTCSADASERRDILIAALLLGAIVIGIGYRFSSYGSSSEPTLSEGKSAFEQRVARGELVDARAFIERGGEIVTASRSKMNVRQLVDGLYADGAVEVWIEPDGPMRDMKRGGVLVATAVIVKLPPNDDALDPLVGEYAAWSGRMANTISVAELESHDLGPAYWRFRVDLEEP